MLNRQAKPGEGGQVPHTERMKIYLAELGEKADSSVQGGTRPVIVLQNNAGNRSSPTVIVAPITSKLEKPHLPTHVVLGQSNLPKQSMVLLEQVMTIDQKLLIKEYGEIIQTYGEVNYLGFDDFKKSDDTYYYCPEDAQIFLRLVVTAKNGKSTNSVSDPTYSRPFALVRATGTMVNAETPVFTGSDDAFRAFTWNKDDMTVQSHSFGADKWVIGKNGDGEGTLSYQWERLSEASGGNYVDITGNDTAETPVLTVTRAEIAAWAEDAYTDSNGRPRIFLRLTVTNTNNGASITGVRKVTVTELTYRR